MSEASLANLIKTIKNNRLSIRELLSSESPKCEFQKCEKNAEVYMEAFFLCRKHAKTLLHNLVKDVKDVKDIDDKGAEDKNEKQTSKTL